MELIERYLQEIGRHLPHQRRVDILSKLRASLTESVEARAKGEPEAAAAFRVIQEMGSPRKVAAAYHPEGQYLIGPALYPLFQLVLGIVFTVIIGVGVLGALLSLMVAPASISLLDEFRQIVGGLPAALGIVVLIFALLQRAEVRPETRPEAFDPYTLPILEGDKPLKRGEQILGIIVGVSVLMFFSRFAAEGGFSRGGLFANPVIDLYFPWIGLSLVLSILLDIVLLWRGRWQASTRIAKISVNVFSLVVLFLLVQGHNAWLGNPGVTGFFARLAQMPENSELALQLVGMAAMGLALAIAFIVTAIDTLVIVYRVIRAGHYANASGQKLASANQ